MSDDYKVQTADVSALLEMVIKHVPTPKIVEGTTQLQVTSIDFSSYIGRIAVGRVARGSVKAGQPVSLVKRDGSIVKSRIKDLFIFEGLGKAKTDEVTCGDICAVTGVEGFEIADTICDFENPEALPGIPIDEPTMSMLFKSNDSPFLVKKVNSLQAATCATVYIKKSRKTLPSVLRQPIVLTHLWCLAVVSSIWVY